MRENLTKKLEEDIIFGVLLPGSRLTEERIIEEYSTKRHAVRTSFAELKTRGLLTHKPNHGVEVISFTPDQVQEIYEIRLILEASAAKKTRLPVINSISNKLFDIATAHKNAYDEGRFREVFNLNKEFHTVQFSCCTNKRLIKLVSEYARIVHPIRVMQYGNRTHMDLVINQHFEIVNSMKGNCLDRYMQATTDHLPASAVIAFRKNYENLRSR